MESKKQEEKGIRAMIIVKPENERWLKQHPEYTKSGLFNMTVKALREKEEKRMRYDFVKQNEIADKLHENLLKYIKIKETFNRDKEEVS